MGMSLRSQSAAIAEIDGRLPRSAERAIYRLLKANKYAQDAGRDAWEFAVTINELRRDGISENELRWLVCRGYIEHAEELTGTDSERVFDHHVSLRLCRQSAFVISPAGIAFSREFLNDVAAGNGRSDGKANPSDGAAPLANSQQDKKRQQRADSELRPKWDCDRRELRLGDKIIKVFKLPSPMQEAILMAFEEEGWPPRIEDPLPGHPDLLPKRRLHDTIKSLNRNQKNSLIRFMGDGTGEGIRWELAVSDGSKLSKARH